MNERLVNKYFGACTGSGTGAAAAAAAAAPLPALSTPSAAAGRETLNPPPAGRAAPRHAPGGARPTETAAAHRFQR
jgi:hypothetical protein